MLFIIITITNKDMIIQDLSEFTEKLNQLNKVAPPGYEYTVHVHEFSCPKEVNNYKWEVRANIYSTRRGPDGMPYKCIADEQKQFFKFKKEVFAHLNYLISIYTV